MRFHMIRDLIWVANENMENRSRRRLKLNLEIRINIGKTLALITTNTCTFNNREN